MPQRKLSAAGRPKDLAPTPLGPTSHTWRDFGSYRYHLMLPEAFVLQSAHPIIDAGVSEHSSYKTDPWGRARRSTKALWPVIYARPEIAIEKGRAVREMHRAIRGVDKHGKRYHALDPEAYAWVHVTGYDSMVRMHELFGTPPTRAERIEMFDEWQQIGTLLGISPKNIPGTEHEYWQYFEDTIQNRLIFGDVVRDLLDERYYLDMPKPPQWKRSDAAWERFKSVVGPILHLNALGTLPELYRERFQIPWSDEDQRRFERFRRVVRALHPFVPFERRYIGLARRAFHDARLHPEAYDVEGIDLRAPDGPGPQLAPA